MEGCMTDRRDEGGERKRAEEAERRELKAAGWEPKGRGARTIWRSPTDGRWYAHHLAVVMLDEEGSNREEARLLDEHGFERASDDGTPDGRERWVRLEEGPKLYTRSQALTKARGEGA
jgi:hypothetical protein